MNKYSIFISIFAVLSVFCFGPASAEIPNTITYQGSLQHNPAGTPVDGSVSMSFALYDSLSGGTELWSDTMTVTVSNGIYSVVLGSTSGNPLELAFDRPYYLEVGVAGTALVPRQPLTSVPYALHAAGMEQITVKNDKVGIGMTNPTKKLDVNGSLHIGGTLFLDSHIFGGDDELMVIYQNTNTSNSRAWMQFFADTSGREGEFALGGTYIDMYYGSTTQGKGNVGMRLASDGNIGIGRTDPYYTLDVAGNLRLIRDTGTNQGIGSMRFDGNALSLNSDGGTADNYPYIEWRRDGGRGAYMGWGKHEQYFELNLESNNAFYIGGGKVGIGTKTPAETLDVAGNIKLSGSLRGVPEQTFGLYANTSKEDSRAWIEVWGAEQNYNGKLMLGGKLIDLKYASDDQSSGVIGIRLNSDGNVGIGTTLPAYKLDVAGTIRGNNVSASDRRWKEEIATLEHGLERVSRLRGVSFRWKDKTRGEGPQIGLIAQDVEEVFPELVSTDAEGYKSVAYDKLAAPLIEAVKALKAENEALKARNDDLERRLEALEAAVNVSE
ncbi:MAG: hypothetical protein GY801_07030 [bacterium]|nr:hypothetical protein [bacterium]